jgi:hypothetical protein
MHKAAKRNHWATILRKRRTLICGLLATRKLLGTIRPLPRCLHRRVTGSMAKGSDRRVFSRPAKPFAIRTDATLVFAPQPLKAQTVPHSERVQAPPPSAVSGQPAQAHQPARHPFWTDFSSRAANACWTAFRRRASNPCRTGFSWPI